MFICVTPATSITVAWSITSLVHLTRNLILNLYVGLSQKLFAQDYYTLRRLAKKSLDEPGSIMKMLSNCNPVIFTLANIKQSLCCQTLNAAKKLSYQ